MKMSHIKWSKEDWLFLVLLVFSGCTIMFTGLSIRSLWGSEGRWAVIAREMIESGNYFMPTINGMLYFDKPLLSYWAIVPFSLKGGVTELTTRLPSAIAGMCSCIITFFIGRRLFDAKTGFISGMLLLTTVMFLFWSRHASADMLNLLFVWLMFWFFIAGGIEGRFLCLLAIYSIGSIGSFMKGPIGLSVALFSMGFYSLFCIFLKLHQNFSFSELRYEFFEKFKWLISKSALISLCIGMLIFLILLLLPVWVTGSWEPVQLMWRENIERFFKPFDHVEPAYAYIKHIVVFTAPWTLIVAASFFRIHIIWKEKSGRLIILISMGILIFFMLSGSRRSYYILPLIPGLMIIAGKSIRDWLEHPFSKALKIALVSTSISLSVLGIVLIYVYIKFDDFRHISEVILSPFMLLMGIFSAALLFTQERIKGFVFMLLSVLILELWVFNIGMAVTEKQRISVRWFSQEVKKTIQGQEKKRVVIYRDVPSSLIFYLHMGIIKEIHTREGLMDFRSQYPDGLVIADLKNLENLYYDRESQLLEPVIIEKKDKKRGEILALLRFRE